MCNLLGNAEWFSKFDYRCKLILKTCTQKCWVVSYNPLNLSVTMFNIHSTKISTLSVNQLHSYTLWKKRYVNKLMPGIISWDWGQIIASYNNHSCIRHTMFKRTCYLSALTVIIECMLQMECINEGQLWSEHRKL